MSATPEMLEVGRPCAIGGWFERFDDRADLWLWHAPDWFWTRDHGRWPNGANRSGSTAPLVATLHMLWCRWWRKEEVCWWGYADDVDGYPTLRTESMRPSKVYRKNGLLSHGAECSSPDFWVTLECWIRGHGNRRGIWRDYNWRRNRRLAAREEGK